MSIFISTNIYNKVEDWVKIYELMERIEYKDKGIEIFPLWDQQGFEELLEKNEEYLKHFNITFHGAYYGVEPSAAKGTDEYRKSIYQNRKTIEWCRRLNGKFVVHHQNNKIIFSEEKKQVIKDSNVQLKELTDYARLYSVALCIENAGISASGNNLWSDDEFIQMALSIPNPILIDVGHVNANRWNIERIIQTLKNKIIAYHIHNNDGRTDCHDRIKKGSFDMEKFIALYNKFTPNQDLIIEYSSKYKDSAEEIAQDIKWLARKTYSPKLF
ncbi:sugar phosphate isomerase/epimerase family protein [Tepidanaerobacter acetatoxydans]|uniref:sugar phosphate isomerase/epimerase family protein n=1 Tax=Tepidanaerobacter acetatoxydans TaxID=499229 RepID=UPI001BD61A80|nr:TIM barrel protein [Tepidanaerobacter acetatoxydans]